MLGKIVQGKESGVVRDHGGQGGAREMAGKQKIPWSEVNGTRSIRRKTIWLQA